MKKWKMKNGKFRKVHQTMWNKPLYLFELFGCKNEKGKNCTKLCKKGFDIISSQFSIHYYFKDELTLRTYIQNISENIKIKENLKSIFITLFLITYANPHVYLDTVILLGSISTNFNNKFLFGLGAVIASFVFFFSLGYLSKFLSKYIYSQKTWFFIDLIVGILMICYGMYFIFY